jgi:hypothetical protein
VGVALTTGFYRWGYAGVEDDRVCFCFDSVGI